MFTATRTKQPTQTHSIIRTFINRHGRLESRATGFHGYDDAGARHHFDQHVRFAENAWQKPRTWNGVPVRTTQLVLIDATENVLAEWTHEPKAGR